MKISRYLTIFALGLMAASFAAKAEDKTQTITADEATIDEAQTPEEKAAAYKEEEAFESIIDDKLDQIMPNQKTWIAIRTANEYFYIYQDDMCKAVQSAYARQGGQAGKEAAARCRAMTNKDFLKTFDYFKASPENNVK